MRAALLLRNLRVLSVASRTSMVKPFTVNLDCFGVTSAPVRRWLKAAEMIDFRFIFAHNSYM
jgi:hypothetical protein